MTEQLPGATNGRRVMGIEAVQQLVRQYDYVEVTGFEFPFRVQELTYGERIKAIKMGPKEPGAQDVMLMPRICSFGWVDEEGKLIVNAVGGSEALAGLPSRAIEKMYERIADMSGFAETSKAEMGKASTPTPSESGG